MLCITKNLAMHMESCIKQTHLEVTRQYAQGQILEIQGGAAFFSGFDSYLSQVVGWGFATPIAQFTTEIERIEQFYKSFKHTRVDIELCPFVGNELAVFLSQRGYCISELNNVSLIDLKTYSGVVCSTENALSLREIKPEERREWSKKVAQGFDAPEAAEQFFHYAQSRGVCAYAVFDKERIVAGATLAMHGEFCDLGVTSTLAAYRGKGLQKQLLIARLIHAKQQGLSWATVTTEPGSISDANVQKIGFGCAYTRIKLTLEIEN